VPGRVLGSEGREGAEGGREPGTSGVGSWGAVGDPEGGKTPSVSAIGDDGGQAGFTRQAGGRRGEELVCCPSLNCMPEAVHASDGVGVGGEEVGTVGKYGKEEAMGDAVAQEGFQACPR